MAGTIEFDMTFLKDEGLVQPTSVSAESEYAAKNKQVLVVQYELFVKVNGRNLVYKALWPVPEQRPDAILEEPKVCAESQTSISATFKPGTA